MSTDDKVDLLAQALGGDGGALDRLVALLTPVIHARVVRILKARRPCVVRQEVEDLVQDVFVVLFDCDARVLRTWDPERGLSLKNFVGLVAERRVFSFLRRGPYTPWQGETPLDDEPEPETPEPGPHELAISRELRDRLYDRLREELSPLGWRMFQLFYIELLSQEEVEAATGLSDDAVYKWRSRLRRLIRELLDELSGNDGPERRS